MTLWSPDLQTMIKNMTNLNATTFWTGFERVNDTFFFEKASFKHANCQSNSWLSGVNQERDSIPELNSGDWWISDFIPRRCKIFESIKNSKAPFKNNKIGINGCH